MVNFKFQWFNKEIGSPVVTIAEYGLLFNKACVSVMQNPEYILIGFDKDNFAIGINPLEEKTEGAFEFAERERNGYVRINSRDFIRYITQYFPTKPKESLRCVARWEEDMGVLIVDLNQVIDEEDVRKDEA